MQLKNLSKEQLIQKIILLEKENFSLKKKTSTLSDFLANKEMVFSVLNLLPYSSLIMNLDTKIIACNELAIQYICKSRENVIGYKLKKFISEKFYTELKERIKKLITTGSPLEFEETLHNEVYHIDIYPIFSDDNKIRQIIFFGRNITSERRLRESDTRKSIHLERVLETAKNVVSCLNINEVLKIIAREVMNLIEAHGCTIYILAKDGKSLNPTVAVDPTYEKEILKQPINIDNSFTGKAVKAKKCMIFNNTRTEQNGFQIPGTSVLENERLIVAPFISDNKVLGALTLNRIGRIFTRRELKLAETFATYATIALNNARNYTELQREIKERKIAEKKIASHKEHLKLINRILRHDLTNNLSVIKSAVRLYKATRKEEYLEDILKSIRKSIDLIRRMKELEIIVSQKRLIAYDLKKVVDKIVSNFRTINIISEGNCRILADETLVSVFNNVIQNSILHGKADTIKIEIIPRDKTCEIVIADNGVGIPANIQDKIFDESYKYGKTGNTGLGLFIVKKAIESFGGKVRVEKNFPHGTKIILILQKA